MKWHLSYIFLKILDWCLTQLLPKPQCLFFHQLWNTSKQSVCSIVSALIISVLYSSNPQSREMLHSSWNLSLFWVWLFALECFIIVFLLSTDYIWPPCTQTHLYKRERGKALLIGLQITESCLKSIFNHWHQACGWIPNTILAMQVSCWSMQVSRND